MYDNIGKKIKTLATIEFVVVTAISFIVAIVIIANSDSEEAGLICILYLLIGPLVAWLTSLILYGFGELIDKTSSIEEVMKDERAKKVIHKQNAPLKDLVCDDNTISSSVVDKSISNVWYCSSCGRDNNLQSQKCWACGTAKTADDSYDNKESEHGSIAAIYMGNDMVECPSCKIKQKAGRAVCWNCGQKFIVKEKCEMCGKEAELKKTKITDDLGIRYRKLCDDCISKHNAEVI